jgi:hypothetical protein
MTSGRSSGDATILAGTDPDLELAHQTWYKAQAIGAYHVRGTRLPGSGYF